MKNDDTLFLRDDDNSIKIYRKEDDGSIFLTDLFDQEMVMILPKDIEKVAHWLLAHAPKKEPFQIHPEDPDTISPDVPLLLVIDENGELYTGQTGGVSCNHPETRGILFNLKHAKKLKDRLYLHHETWCGYYDEEALEAIDKIFDELSIPLVTLKLHDEEGWVNVVIDRVLSKKWNYLHDFAGKHGMLIFNNCD